jgi:hypothetical protein
MAQVINKKAVVGRLFWVLLLLLPFSEGKAQPVIRRKEILSDYLFRSNHFQISVSPISIFKAKLVRETGTYPAKSGAAPGLAVGFKYQINFTNQFSLVTGPELELLNRNFYVAFGKNDFSPPLTADYDSRDLNYVLPVAILSLPVLVEKRWLYSHKRFLYAGAGFRFNVSTGFDLDAIAYTVQQGNQLYDVAETSVFTNNDAKPWISFPVTIGHSWMLSNFNVIGVGVVADFSFTKYVDGQYWINPPSQPQTAGRYSSTGTYLGLSVRYNFTGTNYRLRKILEKKPL